MTEEFFKASVIRPYKGQVRSRKCTHVVSASVWDTPPTTQECVWFESHVLDPYLYAFPWEEMGLDFSVGIVYWYCEKSKFFSWQEVSYPPKFK